MIKLPKIRYLKIFQKVNFYYYCFYIWFCEITRKKSIKVIIFFNSYKLFFMDNLMWNLQNNSYWVKLYPLCSHMDIMQISLLSHRPRTFSPQKCTKIKEGTRISTHLKFSFNTILLIRLKYYYHSSCRIKFFLQKLNRLNLLLRIFSINFLNFIYFINKKKIQCNVLQWQSLYQTL